MQELIADNRIWFGPDGNSVPRLKRFLSETKQGVTPLTIWTYKEVGHNQEGKQELKGMLSESDEVFGTPKPTRLLGRVITIGTSGENNALILDFFAGSGTTGHAVINLNREDGGRRKYILVEMADYFHTVLLPRIKKVVFSDKWREGKAQPDGQGISHFVKYYELEQYEDTLRQTRYLDNDLFTLPATEDPCQYLFLPDPKMLKALKMNLKQGTVKVDLSKLYEDIDLAETLSNLTGKWLRRIHPDPDDPTKPGQVELADGTTADLKNPDWRLIKPLIWW
ncbi:DNA methyltransferase [Roseiflexus castenholzii]|uniref:DNA methyltransferase n=1 Tax=Roseiflexus castenholzii TaxID=120962 RepID=UPI003C7D6D5C